MSTHLVPCPGQCEGTGYIRREPCRCCGGLGVISAERAKALARIRKDLEKKLGEQRDQA